MPIHIAENLGQNGTSGYSWRFLFSGAQVETYADVSA
jgi:hypothetical protein